MTIQTPPGAAPAGSAGTADQAAPLDALLADAALGTVRRVIPDASAAKFAVALALKPYRTNRRMSSLAAELVRIGAGTSALAPARGDRRFADPAWTGNASGNDPMTPFPGGHVILARRARQRPPSGDGRKKANSAGRKLTPEQYSEIANKLLAKWERQGTDQFLHPPRSEPKSQKRGLTKDDAEAVKRRTSVAARPTEPASGLRRVDAGGQSRLERLLEFFRAAGVNAEIGHAGRLWINGSQTEPLAHLPSPDTAEWINAVNEIALKHARDEFIRAVEDNAHFGDGLRVSLLQRERGFVIMRGDVRLGVIHPAHAYLPYRPFIRANFLTSGPHWRQVANIIHHTKTKREQDAEVPKAEVLAVTSHHPCTAERKCSRPATIRANLQKCRPGPRLSQRRPSPRTCLHSRPV